MWNHKMITEGNLITEEVYWGPTGGGGLHIPLSLSAVKVEAFLNVWDKYSLMSLSGQ